ncbi:MAG: hypothetical protein HY577_01170 [Candidatus Nealsonbacteria bacterium]|nr:hypothetical protein [Candidatus Nealsonbacteria bacterium]
MKKTIFVFFVVFSLIYPFSGLVAQGSSPTPIGPPESLEELKNVLLRGWGAFPAAFEAALGEALSFWQKLYQWLKGWWEANWAQGFKAWVNSIWERIRALFSQREAIFQEELQKEKTEMKKEIPGLQKTLWEKLREVWQ